MLRIPGKTSNSNNTETPKKKKNKQKTPQPPFFIFLRQDNTWFTLVLIKIESPFFFIFYLYS